MTNPANDNTSFDTTGIRALQLEAANELNRSYDVIRRGGSGGGGMESRVAKLEALAESTDRRMTLIETDLRDLRKDQRSDFRTTWGGLFVVALGLAALLAKGFGWIG